MGKSVVVRSEVLEMLAGYSWPGNVRELENIVEQAFIWSNNAEHIVPEHLPAILKGDVRSASLHDDTISGRLSLEKAVREAKAGKIEFRVDKAGNLHVPVGKASFGVDKLEENVRTFLNEVMLLQDPAQRGDNRPLYARWQHRYAG